MEFGLQTTPSGDWSEECELAVVEEATRVENPKVDSGCESGEIHEDADSCPFNENHTTINRNNFVLPTGKYKDIKRLKNLDHMMPFMLANHFIIKDDNVIFTSAGIHCDLATHEFRGFPYVINLNNKMYRFTHTRNIKTSILKQLEECSKISKGMKKAIQKDLNLNIKYENDYYYIDPHRMVSFIFQKCSEARNKRPLIVTWQSYFNNMTFLSRHLCWQKNFIQCALCHKLCNNSSIDNDGAYFAFDHNAKPGVICNSDFHRINIDGLVNPVWLNMVTRKLPGTERFQLEFKYENKVTVFTALLPKGNTFTDKKYLSIEDTHYIIGTCRQQHGNPKTISGLLSYTNCIFSTFYNPLCTHLKKR